MKQTNLLELAKKVKELRNAQDTILALESKATTQNDEQLKAEVMQMLPGVQEQERQLDVLIDDILLAVQVKLSAGHELVITQPLTEEKVAAGVDGIYSFPDVMGTTLDLEHFEDGSAMISIYHGPTDTHPAAVHSFEQKEFSKFKQIIKTEVKS